MNFDMVLNGIMRYMDREIFSSMTDLQEFAARLAVTRVINNSQKLKETLTTNPFIKTFGIIDDDGNVDIDGLHRDIKEQIRAKGKLTIKVPLIGITFHFSESDVDTLFSTIKGEL